MMECHDRRSVDLILLGGEVNIPIVKNHLDFGHIPIHGLKTANGKIPPFVYLDIKIGAFSDSFYTLHLLICVTSVIYATQGRSDATKMTRVVTVSIQTPHARGYEGERQESLANHS